MRAAFLPLVTGLATALGCGDGIGRPIVERDSVTSDAGTPSGFGGGGGGRTRGGFPDVGGRGSAWDGAGRGSVPPGEYCARTAEWPGESASLEFGMLEFLNFAREFGVACTSGAAGVAVPPVVMKPELQCAARLHALDMAERAFFDHVNPDGVGPEDRIRRTGYLFRVAGESLARGEGPAEAVDPFQAIEALFSTGGSECQTLVDPSFDSVGIGHFDDLWTLDFAGP